MVQRDSRWIGWLAGVAALSSNPAEIRLLGSQVNGPCVSLRFASLFFFFF